MINEILVDILKESRKLNNTISSEQQFIETILHNIYQYLYKNGQPVHTTAIGILRGNTFDMYYKGRIQDNFAELFGAMSYDTTIVGRACDLFLTKGQSYLHLFSPQSIKKEFEQASKELEKKGHTDEAAALRKRAESTIDQGIRSFLIIPLTYGNQIIGIFTISSIKEYDENHIFEASIEEHYLPLAHMLGLLLYMEKLSYDKADEMSRLLISSIDGKDEYQTTHSTDVRKMIDIVIDELSRDKELRGRIEGIGFKLTVDKIQKLRLAALLHDMGKVFVPSSILRKGSLDKDELLLRKMHSYYTYNMLRSSTTLGDIADIASKHHARYFIPPDFYKKTFIGHPFDRVGQHNFHPESQIIALADTFNSIVRSRPDRDGLSFHEAIQILEKDDHKFHSGLKEIFITILRRVEQNITNDAYSPEISSEYCSCLWLEHPHPPKKQTDKWADLYEFVTKIEYNTLGIISVMPLKDAQSIIENNIQIGDKPLLLKTIEDTYAILSIRDVFKEEGFVWVFKILDYLQDQSYDGKIAFTFVGKNGKTVTIQDTYETLIKGLQEIKDEPVHYYLHPDMLKIT